MKKAFLIFLPLLFILYVFTGCALSGYSNLLLFTDRLNLISKENISLEDYSFNGGRYTLILNEDNTQVLITPRENEKAELKSVGVTLLKVDEKGNTKPITDADAAAYKERVMQVIYAFALFDEDKSREAAEKILPLKSKDLLRTGELTTDIENYHFVYYSNKLCCRFTVTDTYLEKTEITEKPVSRPILQY